MEKKLFIPRQDSSLVNLMLYNFNTDFEKQKQSLYSNLALMGLVNQVLGDKANCKEVVKVSHCQQSLHDGARIYIGSLGIWDGFIEGYLVTYLESKMQFTESDIAYYRMIAEDLTAKK